MTTESEALDRIEQLVATRFPKGTDDELGRALRHQLHRAGRLNEPDPEGPFLVVSSYSGAPKNGNFDAWVVGTWSAAVRLRGRRDGVIRRLVNSELEPEAQLWAERLSETTDDRRFLSEAGEGGLANT